MSRIYIGGAGGAPSNNFIRSLRESARHDYLLGASCVPSDLFLADTDEKYVVPAATDPTYREKIFDLLPRLRPDFLHMQHDYEVRAISRLRDEVMALGIKLYLPVRETVENCVNKEKSFVLWKAAGVPVPETLLLTSTDDLKLAFHRFGPKIWIRAIEGGGGRGALPADNFDFARIWIDRFRGWGEFTASELLSAKSITWQSIWFEGELVVAQTRSRRSWNFGDRTLSGVTGITGVGQTCSYPEIDRLAQDAILAIDSRPHGIFSVDMTYDLSDRPKPTEINIGRFFTTHYFFTRAGINFPEIYFNIALDNKFPTLEKKINPLPDGLIWIRGMDVEPVLTTLTELEHMENASL
jgi:carbamoyl-phosphate synthase large subunit